jgi:hypothetical protein
LNISDELRFEIGCLKLRLVKEFNEVGYYDGFGNKEIKYLDLKYLDGLSGRVSIRIIKNIIFEFYIWCISYDGK